MKAHEFDRVVSKFQFETRESGDLLAWFEYEGRIITRTRRSKGSGDLPMEHSIRQQMKLDVDQMREAIKCTLKKAGYIEILKSKGLI